MDEFEAIRPYADTEVPAVMARLIADPELLDILARFRFPRLAGPMGWALKPLIAQRLRRQFAGIDSIEALQARIEIYLDRTIERATDGITYSGLEKLQPGRAYLFLANHRDIVMDPAFVNYALYQTKMRTPRIAIGDNLLQRPFVSDLMRLNKSFIVRRSVTVRREKLAAYQVLSAYINHSIRNDGESIWIAQAEGRAKDGDDRTDSAILKMLHMSRKDEPFAQALEALRPTPVSISYEYDPCDQAKARELYIRATTGTYVKTPGEDDTSIALGITGHKGRVHVSFGTPITEVPDDPKQLAIDIDRQILSDYRLFPVNYLAYRIWDGRELELEVADPADLFSAAEIARAEAEWGRRLAACPSVQQPYLIQQYAMPVRNQYRVKGGLSL